MKFYNREVREVSEHDDFSEVVLVDVVDSKDADDVDFFFGTSVMPANYVTGALNDDEQTAQDLLESGEVEAVAMLHGRVIAVQVKS
jgi:hypothetical protein